MAERIKKEMSAEEYKALQKEQVKELKQKVQDFINNKANDENYLELLNVLAMFHQYSLHNAILIYSQRREAQHVASFQTWKKMKRKVKKGEKGIKILVPIKNMSYFNSINNKYITKEEYNTLTSVEQTAIKVGQYVSFKVGYVFDITQTEGSDDITEPLKPFSLSQEVDNFYSLVNALRKAVPDYEIRFEEKASEYQAVRGYCSAANKTIVVYQDNEQQMLKTLIHEIGHAILHENSDLSSNEKEIQAESVAYVVMQKLDLPSDEYSLNYLSSWCDCKVEDAEKYLLKGFDAIFKATKTIMSALEGDGGNNVIIA